jgi:hypothetical protein
VVSFVTIVVFNNTNIHDNISLTMAPDPLRTPNHSTKRGLMILARIFPFLFLSRLSAAFTPIVSPVASASPRRASVSLQVSNNVPELDPANTAFVFIEYQNEFCSPGGKLHDAVKECMQETNMLENSSKMLQVARESGSTVIHCPISFEPGHNEISATPYGILQGVKEGAAFTNGEWGADFCAEMRPAPGDLVVKGKSGLCGFMSTNLDFLLSQHNAKNVVLGGL